MEIYLILFAVLLFIFTGCKVNVDNNDIIISKEGLESIVAQGARCV